jgi:hypothetical protein
MTWNEGGDLNEDPAKSASAHPATPDEGPASPAHKEDPGPDDYKNGDTSSWAEDPHPGPYENGEHPAYPDEGSAHPAAKAASQRELERRAAKCIRIATAMLGDDATVTAIEDQALSLMELSDDAIKASLQRLGDDDDDDGESKGDESKSDLDYEGDKKAADKIASFEDRLGSVERFLSKAGYSYMSDEVLEIAAPGVGVAPDVAVTTDNVAAEYMDADEAMLEEMLEEEGMGGEGAMDDVESMLAEMMEEEGMGQNDPSAFGAGPDTESLAPADAAMAMGDDLGAATEEVVAVAEAGLPMSHGDDEAFGDDLLVEEDVLVDPMGVLSTDLNEEEGDLLAKLFTDRRAESEEKKEEDEKGAEAEAAKTIQEDVEEKAKEEKKASDRKPQPKKASSGAKTLGGISKEAQSEVSELAKLWESAPDVSRFF